MLLSPIVADILFHVLQQGGGGSFPKDDRSVLSAIQHLVELERRSLEEVHLNQQAEWNLNVRGQTVYRCISGIATKKEYAPAWPVQGTKCIGLSAQEFPGTYPNIL